MIDPKMVEMQVYNSLPHLALPVVVDLKKVLLALRWLIDEMERRYKIFARVGVRNIIGFNARQRKAVAADGDRGGEDEVFTERPGSTPPATAEAKIPDKIASVVVIVDELA